MSVWITPSLLAGTEPCTTGLQTWQCDSAAEAIDCIRAGRIAWLNTDDWDAPATVILDVLGASAEWTKRQIHAARTGVLLPEEEFTA